MIASFLSELQPCDHEPVTWPLMELVVSDSGCLVGVDRAFLGEGLAFGLDFVREGEGDGV